MLKDSLTPNTSAFLPLAKEGHLDNKDIGPQIKETKAIKKQCSNSYCGFNHHYFEVRYLIQLKSLSKVPICTDPSCQVLVNPLISNLSKKVNESISILSPFFHDNWFEFWPILQYSMNCEPFCNLSNWKNKYSVRNIS